MQNATETQGNANTSTTFIKILAIVGFFASILLIIFLIVRGMTALPRAFDSLADSFASIRNHQQPTEIVVATGKNIVNTKESFTVSWTEFLVPGTYSFTYACTDGVSLDVRSNNTITTVVCNEPITFPASVFTIDVIVASEKNRFVDIPFTIGFKSTDGTVDLEKESRVTIVNATIPQSGLATTKKDTGTAAPQAATPTETKEETPEETAAPVYQSYNTSPQSSVESSPQPQPVTYYPTSNPHGYTDLKVSFLGVGEMNGSTFIPRKTFDEHDQGVLRFSVMNVGTKTSDSWSYTVELPGTDYRSSTELPLKPNELAVFAISFDIPEDKHKETLEVIVKSDRDTNKNNNGFAITIAIDD